MQKIAIITDSSCDLTIDEIKEYNLNILPLKIIYKDINGNEKEVKSKNMLYRDVISLDELYLKLNDFYRCYCEQIDKLLTIIPSKYCCKNSKDFNVLLKCFNIKDIINE